MISQTAEYALRAIAHLASHQENTLLTVGQIAEATQVPPDYLSKVLQKLSRAGLIVSQRGAGGGFRLAKEAGHIYIYDVVQVVDPLQRIYQCPLGLEEHGEKLCPLHQRLDDAMSLIEQQFRATSVADLLTANANIPTLTTPHCAFPVENAATKKRAKKKTGSPIKKAS